MTSMLNRREFLVATLAASTAAWLHAGQAPPARKLRLAVVTTLWQPVSHAWHMAERFLVGYPLRNGWHRPNIEVVSAYVDQRTDKDLSRQRAEEFGFTLYPTIAETLRCGTDTLAVDAVLQIGEHGNYPLSDIGQKKYPRYEFFQQIVEVFRRDGRVVPLFNDKHLSWNFEWAKEMVDTAREMKIPFLAGSSLPVTWRMPDIDIPLGAELEEALCVAYGPVDIYDFHALETIQCMAERRKGGETGVVAMHALRGAAVWEALEKGSWAAGGWNTKLFEACLSRSQTLTQPESFSHRYPALEQMRAFVKEPGRIPLRIRRRPQGDNAPDERSRRRLYVRSKAAGKGGVPLDAVPPPATAQRHVLGRPDEQGRRAVRHGPAAIPGRTDAADERSGHCRHDLARSRQTHRDAAPVDHLPATERVAVRAHVGRFLRTGVWWASSWFGL